MTADVIVEAVAGGRIKKVVLENEASQIFPANCPCKASFNNISLQPGKNTVLLKDPLAPNISASLFVSAIHIEPSERLEK
jgi:hypothetical protein